MSDTITYKDLVEADEAKAQNEPTPEEEEELSECCTATIIHGDICSDCLEHV